MLSVSSRMCYMPHAHPIEFATLSICVKFSCSYSLSTMYHPTKISHTDLFLRRILLCLSNVEFLYQSNISPGSGLLENYPGYGYMNIIMSWRLYVCCIFSSKKGACHLRHCRKGSLMEKMIVYSNLMQNCSILFLRSRCLPRLQKPRVYSFFIPHVRICPLRSLRR